MIWSLQILRFIAAMMVVYVHAAQSANTVTGSIGIIPTDMAVVGRAGVDIFFVLSGVVIAKTSPGMTSEQFVWRRFRRILPIYFVACVPTFFIAAKTGIGWRDVIATIFLWPATDVMTPPLLEVAWSLTFEVLFYLSTAVVLRDRRWLYVIGAVCITAFWLRPFGPAFQILGNPLIVEFLFGVTIAFAPPWRFGVAGIPVGFSALIAAGFLHIAPEGGTLDFLTGQENLQRVFVYGLPAALIVYGFLQVKARECIFTHLGDASYSLYLFHTFAISPLTTLWLLLPVAPDMIVAIGMAAAVLLSWRIHVLVETPILHAIPKRLKFGRFYDPITTAPPPPTPDG